jgi:hypothetical protein
MQLKVYNAVTASRRSTGKPEIRIPLKGGAIRITKSAADACGFKSGDNLSLGQDENNVLDWYIYKDKENGFPCREIKKEGHLTFNSSLLAEDLRACAPAVIDQDKIIRMSIGTEPVEVNKVKFFPIITKSARN